MDIGSQVLSQFMGIPFENSNVQTDNIINSSLTPERAYRMLGLRFVKRWHDLKICSIERERQQAEVESLLGRAASTSDEFERRDLKLQADKIMATWGYEDKLAQDCKAELLHIIKRLKQLPAYTREDFEKAEPVWLEMKKNGETSRDIIRLMESGKLESSGKPMFQLEESDLQDIFKLTGPEVL